MSLDRLFKVFSDKNRISIIEHISQGECCSCQMVESFSISQPTLSYHLKMISDSGIAKARKVGTWNKYTIDKNKIDEMIKFLETLKVTGDCSCK
jgi:ArsR family transcriptional regulator, arsenate/arsenite/antimonite-responsive transcriptional repressor